MCVSMIQELTSSDYQLSTEEEYTSFVLSLSTLYNKNNIECVSISLLAHPLHEINEMGKLCLDIQTMIKHKVQHNLEVLEVRCYTG